MLKIWKLHNDSSVPGLRPGSPALTPAGPACRPADRLTDRLVRSTARFCRPMRRLAQIFTQFRQNTCIYVILLASLFPMTCTLIPQLFSLYFAYSQVVLVMTLVLLPRGAGMRGHRGVELALVCLAKQLRAVDQAALHEVGPSQQGRKGKAKIQFQIMTLWRKCQHTTLVPYTLLVGEDSERRIPIVSRREPTTLELGNSGPTLS